MDWIVEHWAVILSVLGGLVVVLGIVARLTKNTVDDKIAEVLGQVVGKLPQDPPGGASKVEAPLLVERSGDKPSEDKSEDPPATLL